MNTLRVFAGRDSSGVRGIKLQSTGDEVISLSVLRHVEATPEERAAYLKSGQRQAPQHGNGDEEAEAAAAEARRGGGRRGHPVARAHRRAGGGGGDAADRHR